MAAGDAFFIGDGHGMARMVHGVSPQIGKKQAEPAKIQRPCLQQGTSETDVRDRQTAGTLLRQVQTTLFVFVLNAVSNKSERHGIVTNIERRSSTGNSRLFAESLGTDTPGQVRRARKIKMVGIKSPSPGLWRSGPWKVPGEWKPLLSSPAQGFFCESIRDPTNPHLNS